LADILLGKRPSYAPVAGWNRPGVLDQWLVEQTQVQGQTPEERVARTIIAYLLRMYDVLVAMETTGEEINSNRIDGLVREVTLLFIGIAGWDGQSGANISTQS
jgi:hypothetical protein